MRSTADRVGAAAVRLLDGNRRRGVSPWEGRRYDDTCPSPDSYVFQRFRDSCFHTIVPTHVHVSRAAELLSPLQAARPDSFIPYNIFWQPEPAVMAR